MKFTYNYKFMLRFISQLLHPQSDVDKSYFPVSQSFCDRLVQIGSNQLVLPAIYGAIIQKKLEDNFPNDLLTYLQEISSLNQKQNNAILKQMAFLSMFFKKNQINYVFLKGAAMLTLKPYNVINDRMVGDIDILVAEKDIFKAQKILTSIGFNPIGSKFSFVKDLIPDRHLKRIVHPDYIAAVELHKSLIIKKSDKIIPENVLENKILSSDGYFIPSSYHLWLHAIFNWQYNDSGLIFNNFSLRTFLDVVHLEQENVNFNKFEDVAISHFYSLSSLFIEKYPNNNYLSSLIFVYKLQSKMFQNLIDAIIKIKITLSIVFDRLILILTSKIYRNRLIKNPKLLLRRIIIFLKKNNYN